MTNIDRIRDVAMLLPEVEERTTDGTTSFVVDGSTFAEYRLDASSMRVRDEQPLPGDRGERAGDGAAWSDIDMTGDVDWVHTEDRIARSWELVAPQRLLETGGR
ncbi:hypothetical protein ASE95_13140 [Sphingomonas sp. Leaf231]|uniref:hypothetical protein n=1 Tax=Sphingomonas sp. Leaf231 TaxID=1736301 RepID=UPI0006F4997C|nr:hypothetical protein [Sphingomonas sp. Leaf231]KQN90434.1 hypothetical protein ASE95_13140 [Sphingomonas sp. Leaf231]